MPSEFEYLTFTDCSLVLDDKLYYADSVAINTSVNVQPSILVGDRYNISDTPYAATAPVAGRLTFSYYMTGEDPLRNKFTVDDNAIKGAFGGASFQSGYLTAYSWNATPYAPVKINAEIMFFDNLTGGLTDETQPAKRDVEVMSFSDMEIQRTGGAIMESTLSGLQSMAYSYRAQITPRILQGKAHVDRVVFGQKEATMTFVTNNRSGYLALTGEHVDITAYLLHPDPSTDIREFFRINGRLFQKNIQSSVDNLITNTLTVTQHNLTDPATIKQVSPTNVSHGDMVIVKGTNLQNVNRVTFDRPAMFVTEWTGVSTDSTKHPNNINTDSEGRTVTGLHIKIPYRTMTSNIGLIGKGTELQSDIITVSDVGITFLKEINAAGEVSGE